MHLAKSWFLFASSSFISHVRADLPLLTIADADRYNAGHYGATPNQTFHSSNLIGPRYLVSKWDKAATSDTGSHFFLCPMTAGQTQGPMILSAKDLSLVYSDPSWNGGADTRVQTYNERPYLTFWSGNAVRGGGSGGGVLVDTSYHEVLNITTQGLTNRADNHEFQLTPDGTGALFINHHTTTADCTDVGGGKNCAIRAWTFQEVEIATGKPRFTWSAEDHFPLSDSLAPYSDDASQWDWFHMNSLAKTPKGDYLVSARYLSAVILIDGRTGDKIWQVGGKSSDFSFETPSAEFQFQHDARMVVVDDDDDDDGEQSWSHSEDMTLFDNHVLLPSTADPPSSNLTTPGCAGSGCSRGLRIRLNHKTKTVSLVHELQHPAGVQTFAEGGYQTLPHERKSDENKNSSDNVLIAYGTAPAFVEFAADSGEALLEVQAAPWSAAMTGMASMYRVYKMDWVANPETKPDVVVVRADNDDDDDDQQGRGGGGGKAMVYVSWNGATEVAAWVLFGRHGRLPRIQLSEVPRQGFESAFEVSSLPPFIMIEARDARGNVLGSTDWVKSQ